MPGRFDTCRIDEGCYNMKHKIRKGRETDESMGWGTEHVDLAVKILNNPLAGEKKEVP